MIRESKKKSSEKESGRQCDENIALRVLHRQREMVGSQSRKWWMQIQAVLPTARYHGEEKGEESRLKVRIARKVWLYFGLCKRVSGGSVMRF